MLAEHTVWDSASTGSGLGAPRFESASEATSPNSQRSQLSERSLCRLGEEDIEEAYARLLSLPLYPDLTVDEQDLVVEALRKAL